MNVEVGRGEFVFIMGSSGSGKTTLLNVTECLTRPTSSKALVNVINVTTLSDGELSKFKGEFIGFIFQGYNLIPTLTVLRTC